MYAETKKKLIKLLFQEISEQLGISTTDIEICILEIPTTSRGFQSMMGNEALLTYPVDI